ncbi:hypothetical protein [Streptomyces scopuliridis]|uniref:hypothetical protein n=1 Tax=Streptomyces scopuliridis TaxID=452529 RepID=UPI003429623E
MTVSSSSAGTNWSLPPEWAAEVSKHGAAVRTLATDFKRMILVDNKVAIISDHRDGTSANAAFKATHPGLLAFFRHIYDQQWERADPWAGGRFLRNAEAVTTGRSRRIRWSSEAAADERKLG